MPPIASTLITIIMTAAAIYLVSLLRGSMPPGHHPVKRHGRNLGVPSSLLPDCSATHSADVKPYLGHHLLSGAFCHSPGRAFLVLGFLLLAPVCPHALVIVWVLACTRLSTVASLGPCPSLQPWLSQAWRMWASLMGYWICP